MGSCARRSRPGGSDTIINVGAGLDTRPYRMELPSSLRWVEVDHPHVIERKAALLRDETPRCAIEHWGLDLTDGGGRKELFGQIGAASSKAMALTEGVIGYLTVDQVASIADDLHTMPSCELWVTEYFSRRQLRRYQARQPMPAVPVRFHPTDWEGFFTSRAGASNRSATSARSRDGSRDLSRSHQPTSCCARSPLVRAGTRVT